MWQTLISLCLALSGQTPRRRAPRRRPAFRRPLRPRLEALEDRTVLSPYLVTTTADGGPGSLRDAINQVNADTSLQYAPATPNRPDGTTVDEIDFAIGADPAVDPGPGYNATTGVATITPLAALPAITNAVLIDGYTQGQGTPLPASPNTLADRDNAVLKVELNGSSFDSPSNGANNPRAYPTLVMGNGVAVRGLVINRGIGVGVLCAGTGDTLSGNFIGTDVGGTVAEGNTGADVYSAASGATIGGTTPADRNVISGAIPGVDTSGLLGDGIRDGGTGDVIEGNFIGTDASGTLPLANFSNGIAAGGATNLTVGGLNAGARNIVSGNGAYGVVVNASTVVKIQGNFIGTDVNGEHALANTGVAGVAIQGTTGAVIGGTDPCGAAGNLISGNAGAGITLYGSNVTVQGNLIGTDATGKVALGNNLGIQIIGNGNTIGGTTSAARNIISGNGRGIDMTSGNPSDNHIEGNYFGTDPSGAAGTAPGGLGNTTAIFIGDGNDCERNAITDNVIAYGGTGINLMTGAYRTLISSNSIYGNAGLGIDLNLQDTTSSANNRQAAPVLTAAYAATGTTIITGTMAGTSGTKYHLEFFANTAGDPEGRTLLGSADAYGNTSFIVPLSAALPAGQGLVTATATDPSGNTSEFSAGVTATPLPPSSLSGVVWEDFNNDGQVDFGENGIDGVTITLAGTDMFGNAVNVPQTTSGGGAYAFPNLYPGNYTLTETQPAGYGQGIDPVGTAGGSLSGTDQFSVALGIGVNGLNYNFGEQPPAGGGVQHGQTAGIGFWNNKQGQALINALNGGTGTRLADWLAATLPNTFGKNAGSNDVAGQSNAAIAALFQQDFVMKGVKLDAQLLATALAVYATSTTLDPTQAAASYGFTVSSGGAGTATANVGGNGDAFGVANNTTMTLLDLLLAADAQAVNGVLYGGNATKRSEANAVFSAVNEAG